MDPNDKLKTILRERDSFLLLCHADPDGDAIGSMLALGRILQKEGKQVKMICRDHIPEIFSFLVGEASIDHKLVLDDEVLILLDNGDLRRTGFMEDIVSGYKGGKTIINIDHHQKNDVWKTVSVNYADPSASSTSQIVYGLAKEMEYAINSEIATWLLSGIYNDTGGFQHSNTSAEVLDMVAELLSTGAQLRQIAKNISYSKPINGLKLWGKALDRLKIIYDDKIALAFLTKSDLVESGAKEEDISGLVNYLNTLPGIAVAILLYESNDGRIKGSLRTEREDIDLSKIAALFGGGGHKKAAGFMIEGKIEYQGDKWKIE